MKIYADSLFLLNFIIDYLLLLAAGKICALQLKRPRMLLGAAWGGMYAVLAAVWPDFFALWTVKLLSGLGTVGIAYGGLGRFWRVTAAFFAVAAAFGGAVYALLGPGGIFVPVSLRVLALSFALCYAAVSLVFRSMGKRAERTIVQAQVELQGRALNFTALEDTGNELCDPLSGEQLLILEKSAAEELLGAKIPGELTDAVLMLGELGLRTRLLSFSSLGGSGLLVCFKADRIRVNGREKGRLVGIAQNTLSPAGEYRAII